MKKGKAPCRSKSHFARVRTVVEGRPDKFTWKCDHCGKHVMSGAFKAATARVHLAALERNGLCSNLCDATDDHAESRRQEFRDLVEEKKADAAERARKRKYQAARMNEQEEDEVQIINKKRRNKKGKKMKQPKLEAFVKHSDDLAADLAVAKWAFAHNIDPNTMKGPYWKRMHSKLQNVSASYTPMYPKKMFKEMLPLLREQAEGELNAHLKHRKGVGRTLTGDGATKQRTPFINFLVNVPGKGTKLIDIIDCTDHLSTGQVKDAM